MKLPSCPVRVLLALGCAFSAAVRTDAAAQGDRLIAISARAQIGTGANELIAGFVIHGGTPKRVVVRGLGPTLTGFTGIMADPKLTVYNGQGLPIATNDNWSAADAAAMAEAGASPLKAGSKDAALVLTLNPGAYTAIVNGVNNTSGVGLVEVYDLGESPKFIGLSAHARVSTGQNVLVAGFAVRNTAGSRRIFVRATGPALADIGVAGFLADPTLTVYDAAGAAIATNDNWITGDAAAVSGYTAQVGAVPFVASSKDAGLVVDLPSGNYTMHVAGVANTSGIVVLEAFDMTYEGGTPSVSVATTNALSSAGSSPATFTFTRTGDLSVPLTVTYALGGTAVAGVDYTGGSGSVTFPAWASTATVTLTPTSSAAPAATKTLSLTLTSNAAYTLGADTTGSATFFQNSSTLYVASLRPPASASTSTASGTATVRLSEDEKFVTVSANFSNLSSTQTVAYLRIGVAGGQETDLFLLPLGQVAGANWQVAASGTHTAADIVAAIKSGQSFLSIESANYPAGELRGTFVRSTGSQTFAPPPAPPALPATPPTPAEAARFLTQTTFGPKPAEIDALVQKGYATWLNEQFAKPYTKLRDGVVADFAIDGHATTGTNPVTRPVPANRMAAWWKNVLTGEDQLRQRVTFALSEIFVISDVNGTLNGWQYGMANYYDILGRNAFGNYRTLLEEVTLNPMMGIYLSSLRNAKSSVVAGVPRYPDENYAREVMQLFSIGLNELQADGTLKLGANGLPIPTYTQTTISETAKVFTGWGYYSTAANPSFTGAAPDYENPLMVYPAFHDTTAKTIVGGIVLPANQTGMKDLRDTLDALFNHANTGPFICRQLIQRLVTSNPSPGYVYRVAQVFANNGAGVRGDLGAVVRAILTDYEARSPFIASTPGFGKLKEPLLRVSAILRGFNAAPLATTGTSVNRYVFSNPETLLAQASLRSPTVFNFFEPFYIVPGTLAAAGLYAPEYQILTDTTAISAPNQLYSFIFTAPNGLTTDYSALLPIAKQSGPLVDQLNLLLCAGSLQPAHRDRIVAGLNAMAANTTDLVRVQNAIYLVASSPAGSVQK